MDGTQGREAAGRHGLRPARTNTAWPTLCRPAARRVAAAALACCVAGLLWAPCIVAQELTPRAYWPAPKGIKVAIVGYSHVNGDVLFDPSIPLYGVDSRVGGMVVVPFRGRHAVKLGYFVGARTEFGADFDQFLASYQVVFR